MNDTTPRQRGSRFFSVTAIVIAVLVVASFPVTYFIPLATGRKSFTLLRHLHGLAFFAWIGLLVVQTQLVRRGRIKAHRELGVAGVALAGAMVPLGLWQAVTAILDRQGQGFRQPFEFALYNLVDIAVFAVLFFWAIYEATRRIEWHRRLMFVAALNLFGPAFSRIVFLTAVPSPWLDMGPNLVADALLFALAWHDRKVLGRVHPVTLWSILLLIPFHTVEPFIAGSAWWNGIAPAIYGFG
ncbi:hypothetical protein B0I00_0254 [Novosphingobium kunmingense]|uniref:Uncharacterized protein n=1 Tax=Novosphingobium kunmingense TaxID=1211806 RepID=A0A2N0I1K8_9SPHN|nr:hypothetical protein [Novosphingobium kunmingense]PKB25073.1 hypothetical protein B0I00_0254 [Novosphingobium kunmingense]